MISAGALIALAGYILSGPLLFVVISVFYPQPPWSTVSAFVGHYHFLQNLPYYFGFMLLGGMLVLTIGHYLNATDRNRGALLIALALTVVFTGLIFFNYIVQTTFVHNLVMHYRPEYDPIITAFSMVNPLSLCWGIEMWGYAILGVATWVLAVYYREVNNLLAFLLRFNGWMSIAGAILTVVNIEWVMKPAGLAAYAAWNILMIVLMILIYRQARRVP